MEPEEWTADTEPGKEGYPYGIIPRLLLFWMTSEVVWKKNAKIEEEEKRKLYLGESLSEFMREFGLDVSRDGSTARRNGCGTRCSGYSRQGSVLRKG